MTKIFKDTIKESLAHGQFTDWIKYVGLKLGTKSIAIAESDATRPCNRVLKISSDPRINIKTDEGKALCLSTIQMYASGDRNGERNTEKLKQDSGWNEFMSKITLEEGEFIPAVAELKLIQIFGKQLNAALTKICADLLLEDWYFTSTQFSSTSLWDMYFGDGRIACMNNFDEKLNAFRPLVGRVRAVHVF